MTGTHCDVFCDGQYAGRYFCYPGRDWEPQLPYCLRPKANNEFPLPVADIEEGPTCHCEYGRSCDRSGNCVCPDGSAGRFCERNFCPVLKSPKFGSIACLSTDRKTTCVGRCFPGHSFEGPESGQEITLTCAEGRYTPLKEFPPCKSEGYCDLIILRDGSSSVDCKTDINGTWCDVFCGGQHTGRYFCYPGRDWYPQLPYCVRTSDYCPVLKPPHFGNMTCSSTDRQWTCVGRCWTGYSFEGRGSGHVITLTCVDSHYTPLREFPPCKSEGYCELIPQGDRSSFNCTANITGTWCDVICGNQHTGRYFCYPGREWQPKLPYCTRPKDVGERRTCRCEYGDSCNRYGNCVCPVGRTGRFCETTNQDSNQIFCRDLGTDLNGSRNPASPPSSRGFPPGARLQYSCNQGYDLDGDRNIICLANGEWSSERPRCNAQPGEPDVEPTDCKNPGPISNGRVEYHPPSNNRQSAQTTLIEPEYYPREGRLEYICDSGYSLEGSTFLTCRGMWTADPPTCRRDVEPAYCPNPGPISNGRVEYYPPLNAQDVGQTQTTLIEPEYYSQGGRLGYFCDNGYTLQGTAILTCEADGKWWAEQPVCRRAVTDVMSCTDPGQILYGKIEYYSPLNRRYTTSRNQTLKNREFPAGTRLEYYCDDEYILVGLSSLTCQSSGIWSGEPPKCKLDCGKPFMGVTSKILHGRNTLAAQWPWVVAIAEQETRSIIICGGALLSTQTVITAAHCLKKAASEFILYFGKYYRNISLDDEHVLERRGKSVVINGDFKNDTLDSDIALITFEPKMKFSERIQPICLPTGESTARNIITGARGYVTGWGQTEWMLRSPDLKMAELSVLTKDDCRESLRNNVPNFSPEITQNMFCADFLDARQSTCIGDSGSPIVFYDQATQRYTLEGLVSFGPGRNCSLAYTICTKVHQFVSWIITHWK